MTASLVAHKATAADEASAGGPAASPAALSDPEAPIDPTAGFVEAPPAGLYVHVPFCVSICPYCDFVVYGGKAARGPSSRLDAFVAALEGELELRADALDARWGPVHGAARRPLDTVYLGGGTPSLLAPATLARLLERIARRFGIRNGAEVTLEVNPGPDERGRADEIRAAGVTRLSVGAQSFDRDELRALGRRHGPSDVITAVREARAAGIGSISLDLLYDIPGGSLETWGRSVDAAIALEPDHLSLYALTLDDPDSEGITGERGDHLPLRPGARRWREQARSRQDEDRAAEMYELADLRLTAAGMAWYEISSWARPGHRSRHNLTYWGGRTWEAVGPGAHAFDGRTRRWNAARLEGYLAALQPAGGKRPQLPPGGTEPASNSRQREAERAVLALRTSTGVSRRVLDHGPFAETLQWGMAAGLLGRDSGERVVLTTRGRLLSNELFARLI